jgi:hypothetical protein
VRRCLAAAIGGPRQEPWRHLTSILLSGIIAVAIAAAEWTDSGEALRSPTDLLWSLVALLGVVAVLLWFGLGLRRRRQLPPARRPRSRPMTASAR